MPELLIAELEDHFRSGGGDTGEAMSALRRDETAADTISGLLAGFHVEAAERLFETIGTPRARCSAAQDLHFYFVYTDPVPAKAAIYSAIARACTAG